ncbi:MAG TPA: CBS domain-containing protein [Candidatus Bathyarchaeia archaeon]|nr:CBS domain-containing protein [Candidatus Bathyarchaeia archaeon]
MSDVTERSFEFVSSGNLLELFPWILQRTSPTVEGTESIAYEGLLLGFQYVDFLPVIRGGRVVGGITSLEILGALSKTRNSGFHYLIETKIADICRPVGLAEPRSSLQSVLDAMRRTKNGNVCIVRDGELIATISLRDIIRYATFLIAETNIQISELANPAITLPSNATLAEMLDLMIAKGVRRILIQASGSQKVADDRIIVEHAFGDNGITTLSDDPTGFWKLPLGNLPLREVISIDGGVDVAEAWKNMYQSPAQCLVVGESILTPWDVVIRLNDLHKFPTQTSFDIIVADSFMATLRGILGETAANAFLLRLETNSAFTRDVISHKPTEFSEMLREILGTARPVVERAFLRHLYAELRISPLPYTNLNDALSHIRERFEKA